MLIKLLPCEPLRPLWLRDPSLRSGFAGEGPFGYAQGRSAPHHIRHMIAVGGAGSSGLPALASGTFTITNARITSTMNPEIVAG